MDTWNKSLAALTLLTVSPFLSVAGDAAPIIPSPAVSLTAPAPAQDAVNALAARANSPLPPGTRLLSIRIAAGLATADSSRELRDHFAGGDSGETHTINALLRTLGQFPSVSHLQILVEGKPIDSLGGLLSLSDPLPVIRPGTEPALPHRWLHRKAH